MENKGEGPSIARGFGVVKESAGATKVIESCESSRALPANQQVCDECNPMKDALAPGAGI
jgi:hypothetical protein